MAKSAFLNAPFWHWHTVDLAHFIDKVGSSTRSYYSDLSGNVVAMRLSTNEACLTHDPLGRLGRIGKHANFSNPVTSCQNPTQSLTSPTSYSYDLQNRRAARTVGSTTTLYAFDSAGRIISEGTKSGTSVTSLRDYVWLDGRPLAQVERGTGPDYAVHTDHLGTPRAMTNSLGTTTVWTATWRPFGDVGESTVTDPVNGKTVKTALRLPGQYDDKGLETLGFGRTFSNWNRWYGAQAGRYLEDDPEAALLLLSSARAAAAARAGPNFDDPGMLSDMAGPRFGYAGLNPLRRIDREGLVDVPVDLVTAPTGECWLYCNKKRLENSKKECAICSLDFAAGLYVIYAVLGESRSYPRLLSCFCHGFCPPDAYWTAAGKPGPGLY
jgi:hypothetical protein